MQQKIWTIVPMRGFERGKARLASVIDPVSRANLNRWLLARTLKIIEYWCGDLNHCIVVSPCDQVRRLAQSVGAAYVRDRPDSHDMNGALTLGILHAVAGGAGKALVLACDLPDLTSAALDELTTGATHAGELVLAADKLGKGTNALFVDAIQDLEFCFGEDSLARHRQMGAARGWQISVVERPDLGFDLDTPDDLSSWLLRRGRGGAIHC